MTDWPTDIKKLRYLLDQKLVTVFDEHERPMIIRMLIEHFGGRSWRDWTGKSDSHLLADQLSKIQQAVERLLVHEPIQYVIEEAHFYGRDFTVSPSVLIPRRETEELVVWIRDYISTNFSVTHPVRILDIGTGSGCIAISLEQELKQAGITSEVRGIDISKKGLEIARANAEKLSSSCIFSLMDVFELSEDSFTELDIIVSNPPYVRESERTQMAQNVVAHEPATALFVPDHDPLVFYKCIASLGKYWLRPGGQLFMEINESLGQEVLLLMKEQGFSEPELRKDMQGKDRFIRVRN